LKPWAFIGKMIQLKKICNRINTGRIDE